MFSTRLLKRKNNLKHFVFEITQDCNQNCSYCYNVWRHRDYPKGFLSIDKWKKIILKLKEETKVNLISLSGGEPLLYLDLVDLIQFIREQNIKINLLTNGSLIDEKTAKKLSELEISIFEIPLVSYRKNIHQKLKGTNDFDRVVDGIANLQSFNNRIVTVFVATKENIADLKETVEFGIALGSSGLMFNRINPACKKHISLLPSVKQLKESLEFLNNFSKEYNYPISCSIPMQPCLINMKEDYINLSYGYCPSGNERSYYTVDSIGNLRICNHTCTILGNILINSLSEIISDEFVSNFKKAIPNDCLPCKYSLECRGGCKASAQVCSGNIFDNDPFFEENKMFRGFNF